MSISTPGIVTPYAGVWIETRSNVPLTRFPAVTPYAGVWIETSVFDVEVLALSVTPYAGVWIETVPASYY